MAINSLSTGWRPGVCTSSTRPTAPYEGQFIYETDTDKTLVWDGSAWLYLSTPQTTEIGKSVSYTPTLTGITLGNGTLNSRYALINNVVHYEGKLTFGTTTSITATAPQLALPFNTAQAFQIAGTVVYADSGVATYSGLPIIIGLSTFYLYINNFATSYGGEVLGVSSTVPFTWGNADNITWSFSYQKA